MFIKSDLLTVCEGRRPIFLAPLRRLEDAVCIPVSGRRDKHGLPGRLPPQNVVGRVNVVICTRSNGTYDQNKKTGFWRRKASTKTCLKNDELLNVSNRDKYASRHRVTLPFLPLGKAAIAAKRMTTRPIDSKSKFNFRSAMRMPKRRSI